MPAYTDELFIALQRLAPQHLLSRLAGSLANTKSPVIKNLLIRLFIKHYQIDLSELKETSPDAYPTFNSFFTRPLKTDARPVCPGKGAVASPADGYLNQAGSLDNNHLIQAKGRSFSIEQLLGRELAEQCNFTNGLFATIYLSPKDYHRVHMPLSANLHASYYIPGKLFSVNQSTAENIHGLFARNERLVCLFDSAAGRFAQVLVGAMLVAGIESAWHGHYAPATELFSPPPAKAVALQKGDEMGLFRFGSTVILLFEKDSIEWNNQLQIGGSVKMGQEIATRKISAASS